MWLSANSCRAQALIADVRLHHLDVNAQGVFISNHGVLKLVMPSAFGVRSAKSRITIPGEIEDCSGRLSAYEESPCCSSTIHCVNATCVLCNCNKVCHKRFSCSGRYRTYIFKSFSPGEKVPEEDINTVCNDRTAEIIRRRMRVGGWSIYPFAVNCALPGRRCGILQTWEMLSTRGE